MMLFTGTIHPDLGARDRGSPRDPLERIRDPPLREHRALLPGEGERPRSRLLHRADALRARERGDHGAADHDRRDEAGVRQAHHRGDPVLRLLPAGPQGAVARADQREARRRHADGRRRRPDHLGRPPLRPDPGVLRRAVRPPDGAAHPVGLSGEHARACTATTWSLVAPDAGRIKTAEALRKYLRVPCSTSTPPYAWASSAALALCNRRWRRHSWADLVCTRKWAGLLKDCERMERTSKGRLATRYGNQAAGVKTYGRLPLPGGPGTGHPRAGAGCAGVSGPS